MEKINDLIKFAQENVPWIGTIIVFLGIFFEFSKIKINPLSWMFKTLKNKVTEDIQKDNLSIHEENKKIKEEMDQVYHIKSKHYADICQWQSNTDKMVDDLKVANGQLVDLIGKLSDKLDEMSEDQDEDKMSRKRWEILSFADSLKAGNKHSRDSFHHIFDTNSKYHDLIQKRGFTNGLVDVEMEYIAKVYKSCLENNDFN